MTAPLSPAPALTAEEAAPDPSPEEQRQIDRFGMFEAERSAAAAQIAAQVGTTHHGLTVMELGEDGGTLVVLGHHDDRRTLAALNRYARTVWGDRLNGLYGAEAPAPDEVQRVRAIVVHACEKGWAAAERRQPASALELVDPDDNSCEDCARTGANWALLYAKDAQDHPAAFPVTVWEYDA